MKKRRNNITLLQSNKMVLVQLPTPTQATLLNYGDTIIHYITYIHYNIDLAKNNCDPNADNELDG